MTLQRVLEPEVMDSPADAHEYNEMDHSEVNERFVSDLLEFLQQVDSLSDRLPTDSESEDWIDVLDMGTGTALIPVELCQRHPAFRVMAIDMAVSMLDLAQFNVESESLAHRIQLEQIDAKSMGFDNEMFDVVMSNSIIHHLPEPAGCLEEMLRVTATGGALFVRDLMRPADQETLEQLVKTYAGDATEYCQRLFRESLHAALSLEEIQTQVQQLGFDSSTVTATSDRHWTWCAIVTSDD